jgi:hypothetical protein
VSPQIAIGSPPGAAARRGADGDGQWPGADLTLEVVASTWHGLGQGRGRLRRHEIEVRAHGRGAASRPRRARLWLPAFPISSSTSSPSTPLLALATSPRDEARDTTRSAAGRYEREVA